VADPLRRRAFVVVDLGFGDAGKGLLTDFLVRRTGARLVVRYNGGAQAGHNVVTPEGRHHTFAQFGAGTFVPGVRTYLSRHVAVHPAALRFEAAALAAQGVDDALDRLRISEGALVITPYHQAAGRLRELARGAERHGSCGAGVGEAVGDALAHPGEAVRAGDLRDRAALRRKLRRVRDRKRAEVEALGLLATGAAAARELSAWGEDGAGDALLDRFVDAACPLAERGLVTPDSLLAGWLAEAGATVFEGAQGVLLDEDAGFHPFTTWSRCTPANALEILAEASPETAVERIGVLRSHAVRHGPGPFPTEAPEIAVAVREHNTFGDWQGAVRYGWFDAVLARYALAAAGPLERLAVTHLDVPPRLGHWRVGTGYQLAEEESVSDLIAGSEAAEDREIVARLTAPSAASPADLARQARLTALLTRVTPRLEDCAPTAEAGLRRIEDLLGRGVDFVSDGPRSTDVRLH
jgi:adenylosuccinate synthase